MTDKNKQEMPDPKSDFGGEPDAEQNASNESERASSDSGDAGSDAPVDDSSEQPAAADDSAASTDDDADSNDESNSTESAAEGEESADGDEKPPEDELPEWEPLTPEIVEDEAIRGDFMLRWAVILLAFLLGCREVAETLTLVRIRTGEYIASNGFWPPSNDVFSYTAAESGWSNPGWLFDLVLAGLFGIGGAVALSIFTALIAAVTFYLLAHISRPELPTWWSSVCAAVTLMVVNPQFTAQRELVTIVGVAWLLRSLFLWLESGESKHVWCVVISLFVWSNLDPRAFIGWLILASFLLGSVLSEKLGRRSHHANASIVDLAKGTAAGLIAMLLNPFGFGTLLSPFTLYGAEQTARAYYAGSLIESGAELHAFPLFSETVLANLGIAMICGFVILGLALLSCLMNYKRADLGLCLALLVTSGLAMVASHELAAASIVACIVASVNGQDWYRANCRQEYSVENLEVLWSRGGRALTVIGLAAVAWFAISGRMMGETGTRIGIGFTRQLATVIESSEADFADAGDLNVFTFRPDQGDLLIWNGRKSFIDSRLAPFVTGSEDLTRTHDETRHALRAKRGSPAADAESSAAEDKPASDDPARLTGRKDVWTKTFDRFEIGLVAPRLWGKNPDYDTWIDLVRSPDWAPTRLGASTALFVRMDKDDPQLKKYLDENAVNFAAIAFDDCRIDEAASTRLEWPRPASEYQQFLTVRTEPVSAATQRARHELTWMAAGLGGAVPLGTADALALGILAIRDAAAGLGDDETDAEAYHVLAQTYALMNSFETGLLAQEGLPGAGQQRYFQRIHALVQVSRLRPDDIDVHALMAEEYFRAQKWDLALGSIDKAMDLIRQIPDPSESQLARAQQLNEVRRQLEPQRESMLEQVNTAMESEDVNRAQVIAVVHQQGFPLKALELFEEDRLTLSESLPNQLEYAMLLVECGRLEDAEGMFASFEQLGDNPGVPYSWVVQSAWLMMAKGDYLNAARLCRARLKDVENSATEAMLSTGPFIQPPPVFTSDRNVWPATMTAAATRVLYRVPVETSQLRWTLAMALLESGKCGEATDVLQASLEADPESMLRPLVAVWLELLTGEPVELVPATQRVPILFEDGPEDPLPTTEESPVKAGLPEDSVSVPASE